jgi:hypothetical protein
MSKNSGERGISAVADRVSLGSALHPNSTSGVDRT